MSKPIFEHLLDKVKRKINKLRFDNGLGAITGEYLNCIANRDIRIIMEIVSAENSLNKEILQELFPYQLLNITELLAGKNYKNDEQFSEFIAHYHEEIEFLEVVVNKMRQGSSEKDIVTLLNQTRN